MGTKLKKREEDDSVDIYRRFRFEFQAKTPLCIRIRQQTNRDGGEGALVTEWHKDNGDFEGKGPDEVSKMVMESIEEDSRTQRGFCRYAILFYSENKQNHSSRLFLNIRGQGADSEDAVFDETEQPDERGQTSQMMRHNEAYARIAIGAVEKMATFFQKENERKDAAIEKYNERMFKVFELTEAIADRSQQRDLALTKEKRVMKLQDDGMELISKGGPLLLLFWLKNKHPAMAAQLEMIMQAEAMSKGAQPGQESGQTPIVTPTPTDPSDVMYETFDVLQNNEAKLIEFASLFKSLPDGEEKLRKLIHGYSEWKARRVKAAE